ncbi:MAG: extracellular solute-binding protein [Opitutaceae bacterium]
MNFPLGRAPFFLLLLAVASGLGVWLTHGHYGETRADLILATHARLHADIYRARIPEFEKRYNVKVDIQEVEINAMRRRLQAAFLAGTEVPDLVEVPDNIANYINGPLKDIGFLDLTDWVKEKKLDERIVASRFSLYTTRGRIFALPHDVHPVMLAYRADIVEDQLGIDVSTIKTWDDFVAMGRKVTKDLDGDGTPDRYALELSVERRSAYLQVLMSQRGDSLFNSAGEVAFDNERMAELLVWYVSQLRGPNRIAFNTGEGQPMWRAMMDGLVLFYFMPDWRTRQVEQWAPGLEGKMKLMPLPAWTPGGIRTSTWGSTGLGLPKRGRNPELAKKLAEFLYTEISDGGAAWSGLHILPPSRDAWQQPEFEKPSAMFRGQPFMKLYAQLAPDVPAVPVTPFQTKAENALNQVFQACDTYYRANGERGFLEYARTQLKIRADQVRLYMTRGRFLKE